jgi:hypothetical protein
MSSQRKVKEDSPNLTANPLSELIRSSTEPTHLTSGSPMKHVILFLLISAHIKVEYSTIGFKEF